MGLEPRMHTAWGPDRSYKLTTYQADTSVLLTQTEVYVNFPIRLCPVLTHFIVFLGRYTRTLVLLTQTEVLSPIAN